MIKFNNVFAEKYTLPEDYDPNDNFFVVSEVRKWKKDNRWAKKYNSSYYWGRTMCLYFPDTNTTSCSGGGNVFQRDYKKEYCIDKNTLIYVGKWHYVKKMDKNIRYVACQTDQLHGYFEVMDEKNKDIKYMPLKLKYPIKPFTRESEELNIIKWFDRYGYNAYVDLKTGEIKEAKE